MWDKAGYQFVTQTTSKRKGNCAATNFIIISNANTNSKDVAKQSEIILERNSFIFVATFNGYSFS